MEALQFFTDPKRGGMVSRYKPSDDKLILYFPQADGPQPSDGDVWMCEVVAFGPQEWCFIPSLEMGYILDQRTVKLIDRIAVQR